MKIVIAILIAVVGFLAAGHGQEQDPQVYCGRRLAQTLAWLCQADYLVKRSGHNSVQPGYNSIFAHEQEYGWPWVTAAHAHGLRPRGKRQVVSECCEKPCTFNELLMYCN